MTKDKIVDIAQLVERGSEEPQILVRFQASTILLLGPLSLVICWEPDPIGTPPTKDKGPMTKDKVASVVQWRERRSAKAEAPGSIPGRRISCGAGFRACTSRSGNSDGRVPVFQTGCRGFEAHPLHEGICDLRLPI